jgi:hypothetical protein
LTCSDQKTTQQWCLKRIRVDAQSTSTRALRPTARALVSEARARQDIMLRSSWPTRMLVLSGLWILRGDGLVCFLLLLSHHTSERYNRHGARQGSESTAGAATQRPDFRVQYRWIIGDDLEGTGGRFSPSDVAKDIKLGDLDLVSYLERVCPEASQTTDNRLTSWPSRTRCIYPGTCTGQRVSSPSNPVLQLTAFLKRMRSRGPRPERSLKKPEN